MSNSNPGIRVWPWADAPADLREAFAAATGREVNDHPFYGDDPAFLLVARADDPISSVEVLPSPPGRLRYTVSDAVDTGTGLRASFTYEGVAYVAMVWVDT